MSAGYARAFLDFAVSRGCDRDALLRAAGIAPRQLEDQDGRVPMARYVTLVRAAKAASADPALPLAFSAETNFEAFSIVGLICLAAPTMGEALAELSRYRRLIAEVDAGGDEARFQLVPDADGLWLEDRRPDPNAFPELTEAAFARFACEFARRNGDTPFILEVQVTHPRPDHARAYDAIFKVPVTFGAARNALRIDPAWLSLPTANPNRYVFGVFNERAERLLAELEAQGSVRSRLESLLITQMHRGAVSMAASAKALGMSQATLRRRLSAEDASFEAVLDALRRDMAQAYLSDGRLSVNETAYLLGFSDPSAFSRAFKRWTGKAPRTWTRSRA
ncbi:AraC family transcriptional regulator [Phenylobacterium conjunctum]|uniref:AraC family transcriptional regulator n=1 Tax=Phenylobacterium conjunctum TaxID=1298959 RepID=A0ABW3T2I0_9CAUL